MKDKILILDDDPIYAKYIKTLISKHIDADIVCETDPLEAIKKISSGEIFSIVILDIKMPIMDGFETAKKIREFQIDMPIVILTGFDYEASFEAHIQENGISDIINKDMKENSLLFISKIKMFMNRHNNFLKKNKQAENQYKKLFDNSSIALWEEDISKVREMMVDLPKSIGKDNIEEYLNLHPHFVERALDNIIVKKVNLRAVEMFGAESCDHLKTSLKKTFTEKSYSTFKKLLIAIISEEKEFSSDVQYKTFQNKIIDAHIFIKIPTNDKDYSSMVFNMIDISYIKHLEKKSKTLYDAVTKSPIIILTLLPTETYFGIEFISDNVYNLLNYTSQDFKEGKITLQGIVHQDDIDKQVSLFQEQIALKNSDFYLQFRIYAKDRSIKWIKMIINPSWDTNNELSYLQCIAIDITPEVTLQNKLTNSLVKWKTLIESTNTAYIILNDKGIIEEANERMISLLGCKEMSDLVGRNPRSIIAIADICKYDSAIKKLLNGEGIENLELNIHSNEFFKCSATWISMNAGIFENGRKKIFCLMRDITELKLKEVKKFILNQKKRDMLRQNILKIRNKLQEMGANNQNITGEK